MAIKAEQKILLTEKQNRRNMCFHYEFIGVSDAIVEAYLLEKSKWKALYNIILTQNAPMILLDLETKKTILQKLYWGFVPQTRATL